MQLDSNVHADLLNAREINRYISVFTNLDMQLVQSIIGGAEAGKIGELYQLYEYLEASDVRLKGMMSNRRKAVTRLPYAISASNLDNPASVDAAAYITRMIDSLQWRAVLSHLIDGRLYGVQIMQKVWARDLDGRLYLQKIKPVDRAKYQQANWATSKSISPYNYGELLIAKYAYGGQYARVADLAEDQAVVIALDRSEPGKYDYAGVMRGVARWYLVKLFAIISWSRYAEKFGVPVVTATVSEQDYARQSQLLLKLVSSVGANSYGVLLEGMDYKIHNGASAANVDIFDKLIGLCNTEIAIGLLGQNLTTDVSGGSFAAARTHMEVLNHLTQDDVEWLDEIVNDQIIYPVLRANFPDLDPIDYPFYTTQQPKIIDVDSISRGLQTASKLVEIPKSYIYKVLNIPEPVDDEPTIGGADTDLLSQIRLS